MLTVWRKSCITMQSFPFAWILVFSLAISPEFAMIINYDNNIIAFDSLKARGTEEHQKWALINNCFCYENEKKEKSPA